MNGQNEKGDEISKKAPCRKDSLMLRDLDEETILYDPDTRQIHILNKTAFLVWQLCDGMHSIADMTAAITRTCSLTQGEIDRIEHDVRSIVSDFEAQGMVK
ncbi:MAG: PqqD family protein [bacterium]